MMRIVPAAQRRGNCAQRGSMSFDYRRLYDRLAPYYAAAMRVVPLWRGYTEAVLPFVARAEQVLEIGPGPGGLLGKLAAGRSLSVGIDLSHEMLRRAGSRLRCSGLPAHLAQADAVALPLLPCVFDAVVMTFAFSAMPQGEQVLCEVHRVLKPGGLLALVDAGLPSDGNRIGTWLAHLWTRFGDHLRDEASMVREVGFEVLVRKEFGAFRGIRLIVARKSTDDMLPEPSCTG
ncbi:MAG: class I SAM-dependent methyltransferase [Chloroflexi bacterium]|nr:class I SAM-dependent methyltransferase [Chloroflexota bacterium]